MDPAELVEIRHIEQLKYRYMRYLDLKQWDQLAELLTPDATASYGGGAYAFSGRDEIMSFLRRSMDSKHRLTSHKVHHPEIELTGPATATGTWALEDRVVEMEFGVTIAGAAYYHDEYTKSGDIWRIAHTGYKRVYEELQPRPNDLNLTASWWGTDGRSEISAGEQG